LAIGCSAKCGGITGKMGKGPLAALDFIFLGAGQFQQMTDGRGENVVVALEVVVVPNESAEARARSAATDGFSVMISFLLMGVFISRGEWQRKGNHGRGPWA
jgi:hypothetical protein